MDAQTRSFIGSAFGPDYMNEPEVLREGLRHSLANPGPYSATSATQRDEFAEVIRTRELSLADWDDITEGVLSFAGEADLYAYLEQAYGYFFGDAVALPHHPED
uniref:CdiI immunity protein domain-containing protein n=1 Tax=Streptomyces sp. NBC_00049 TaxID=2903617 RepID=A0AAU2JMU8_9ACTN